MTTTEFPFRVTCACCGTTIGATLPSILTEPFPFCARCEVEALFHDVEFAWIMDGLECDNHPEEM